MKLTIDKETLATLAAAAAWCLEGKTPDFEKSVRIGNELKVAEEVLERARRNDAFIAHLEERGRWAGK
jgi:hypothetical protein